MYIFCLALFAAWMMPLHLPPWISWHKEVLVFLGLYFWVGEAFFRHISNSEWSAGFRLPKVVFFPLALIGLAAAQYGTGLIVFGGDVIVVGLYFLCAAVALSLGFGAARQDDVVQALAVTFLVGGVLSTGIALAQSFCVWEDSSFIASVFGYRRPGANLTQPNQLATLLLFSWASLVFLYLKSSVGKYTLALATLWLFLGIAVTESRTGLISLLVLMGWCLMHRNSVCRKLLTVALGAGFSFYIACLVSWPTVLQWFWMDGATVTNPSINVAAGTRLVVWPQLWEAVLLRPWFGWGLLNVTGAYNAVLHNYPQGEAFSYAHNIVLDTAIGLGLPLTAIVFGALIQWFVNRLKTPRSTVTWYCFAVMVPLSIHSMLEFPFAYSFLLFPVVLLAGVIESREPIAEQFLLPSWTGAAFVVGATVFSVVFIREYLLIEEDFRVARFEALRVGQTDLEYEKPSVYVLTQLDVMLQATRIVPDVDMPANQIETLRLATMRFPWSAIQNRYALSLALNGNPQEAMRQLKVMRAMHGDAAYKAIQANWEELRKSKFPQLAVVQAPVVTMMK